MKKSNAQAETPSSPGELLRASRPRTEVFEQNAQADLVPLRDVSTIFFLFFNRLQAQATPPSRGQAPGSRSPGHCDFFY